MVLLLHQLSAHMHKFTVHRVTIKAILPIETRITFAKVWSTDVHFIFHRIFRFRPLWHSRAQSNLNFNVSAVLCCLLHEKDWHSSKLYQTWVGPCTYLAGLTRYMHVTQYIYRRQHWVIDLVIDLLISDFTSCFSELKLVKCNWDWNVSCYMEGNGSVLWVMTWYDGYIRYRFRLLPSRFVSKMSALAKKFINAPRS